MTPMKTMLLCAWNGAGVGFGACMVLVGNPFGWLVMVCAVIVIFCLVKGECLRRKSIP